MKPKYPTYTPDEAIAIINKMVKDIEERYGFAEDTLEGIRDTISERNAITENQTKAINNIRFSVREPM